MDNKDLLLYQKKIGYSIENLAKVLITTISKIPVKNFCILYRIKNAETLRKKMKLKKVKSVFEVEDIYAFRILVSDNSKIYAVSKLIMKKFDSYLDHDYIKTPKIRPSNPSLKGKSLRLLQLIVYKKGVPFEIQITTREFNKSNELLHNRYHNEKYS